MNYIGSKHRLSGFLIENIENVAGKELSEMRFCDLFAGTGIVGRLFKTRVKQVTANDLEYYSFVLNRNYIGNHLPLPSKEIFLEELNQLQPKQGFIYANYSLKGQGERRYFSDENAGKIDAIRQQIEDWKETGVIDINMYYFLLASLLESADKVANTASVYGAFLKDLKKTAQKKLNLEAAKFEINDKQHQVFQQDANDLISEIDGDILYLDPPYNARQYGANYHLLNTIALYDDFIPKGKTGLRSYKKSDYCSKPKVAKTFEELISRARFKYIFLSYNNEGLMPLQQIREIMQKYGRYDVVSKNYQRFKADSTGNRNHKASSTQEYLHILEK